jgi:hypothetical protein
LIEAVDGPQFHNPGLLRDQAFVVMLMMVPTARRRCGALAGRGHD